jgi:Flp pilus assembly protein TadD
MQMITWFLKTCLIVTAIVCFLSTASAQTSGTNVLQGKVVTPNGQQPTGPVRVRLTYNGRLMFETFTDLSGRFNFPGLQAGTYQLTAEGDGRTFETTSVEAEVSVFGRAGQTITQDIRLRAIVLKGATQPGVINAFRQDIPENARLAFEQGLKLADSGKPEEAINKFNQAVQAFPKYFDAHLQLGNLFLKTGRTAEAIAELDLAREINPNDERAYQSFGLLLMGQKNYPVAVAVFAEAERLNPTNPMNAVMKGTALIHQSANEADTAARTVLINRADQALTQALKLSDNKAKPDSLTLALFYDLKGEPERAATELETHLRKAPQAKNAEALKSEVKRLREKAQNKTTQP